MLTISTVDDQNIGVFDVVGWSTKVGDEVMAELAKIMNSVKAIAR